MSNILNMSWHSYKRLYTKFYWEFMLYRSQGIKAAAARMAGTTNNTLERYLDEYNINPQDFKDKEYRAEWSKNISKYNLSSDMIGILGLHQQKTVVHAIRLLKHLLVQKGKEKSATRREFAQTLIEVGNIIIEEEDRRTTTRKEEK